MNISESTVVKNCLQEPFYFPFSSLGLKPSLLWLSRTGFDPSYFGGYQKPQLLLIKMCYKDTAGFVKNYALSRKERIEKEKNLGKDSS